MSIISSIFGNSWDKYSDVKRSVSEREIKDIVSRVHVNTLSEKEEPIVEIAIIKARSGESISLKQIDRVLARLMSNKQISIHDRQKLMERFVDLYEKPRHSLF